MIFGEREGRDEVASACSHPTSFNFFDVKRSVVTRQKKVVNTRLPDYTEGDFCRVEILWGSPMFGLNIIREDELRITLKNLMDEIPW